MAIARYTLAVDRRNRRTDRTNEQTADFIPCVAFDRAAEFAEKYFRQGMRVLIAGRIQTGSYRNKDGQMVYTTDVIVDDQEFADSRQAPTETQNAPQAQKEPQARQSSMEEWMTITDDLSDLEGLPFN